MNSFANCLLMHSFVFKKKSLMDLIDFVCFELWLILLFRALIYTSWGQAAQAPILGKRRGNKQHWRRWWICLGPPHAAAERTFNTTHCAYQNPEAPPTERGREEEDEKRRRRGRRKKLVEQSDLLFGKTATRLPVILKRTIQHRPVLSKLDKLSIISLVAHM